MKLLKAEAGVNDGKAGLLSAAGLFAKGGIFDKKSESFNIQELDPYLLFDARSSMLGTLENPTLDLDPATPSTLDVITATRAGTATYTDSANLIQVASADTVRVDYVDSVPMILVEPSSENLITYSEDFSHSAWGKYGVSVTPSFAQSPDNTTSGSKITDIESSDGDVGLSELVSVTPSTTYTFSTYLKASNDSDVGKKVKLWLKRNAGTFVGAAKSVTLSSEWVRHSVTITLASDNTAVWCNLTKDTSSPAGERADECLIWGAQFESGSVATSYIPTSGSTVTRAADDLSIRDRTNLVPYSEDFSQSAWVKNNATVVDNSTTSPDGSLNAAKLVESATTSTHRTYIQVTTTAATHSFSLFAKAGGRKRIGLRDNQVGNSAVFDLESGSVISGSGGSIAQAANGFFRITLTATYAAAGTRHEIYTLPDNATTANASYEGDGTSGVYIWGAQLEEGSESTSLIPTSGAAASRTTFSDFYNASEGTVYVEANVLDNDLITSPHIFEISDGTEDNRIKMHISSSNNFIFRPQISGSNVFSRGLGSVGYGSLDRIALSYETNNYVSSLNGSSDATDTGAVPSNQTQLVIGGSVQSDPRNITGRIRRLLFWPYHSDRL